MCYVILTTWLDQEFVSFMVILKVLVIFYFFSIALRIFIFFLDIKYGFFFCFSCFNQYNHNYNNNLGLLILLYSHYLRFVLQGLKNLILSFRFSINNISDIRKHVFLYLLSSFIFSFLVIIYGKNQDYNVKHIWQQSKSL